MSKIDAVTKRTKVGECPACKAYLWADVDIEVSVTEPEMRDGKAVVFATPHLVGMVVAHSCWTDVDGERQRKDTEQLGDMGGMAEAWDAGYSCGNRHNGRRDDNPYRTTTHPERTDDDE